jgi:hypothetical protein
MHYKYGDYLFTDYALLGFVSSNQSYIEVVFPGRYFNKRSQWRFAPLAPFIRFFLCRKLYLQQSQFACLGSCLGAVLYIQLVEDIDGMPLDGANRDDQFTGNLFVGTARSD